MDNKEKTEQAKIAKYEEALRLHHEALAPLYTRLIRGGYISVGPGWYGIVLELDQEIAKLDPDYKIAQVKEKFARLRYYIDTSDSYTYDGPWREDPINILIEAAEQKSAITCETCGEPGSLRSENYWVVTLCDACVMADAKRKL